MEKLLFIGLGGFLGSISRYMLSRLVYHSIGETFPYGTLAVNIIGCFLIGLLMSLMNERLFVQPNVRMFLIIGLLGGFTTFSSFSFETFELMRSGQLAAAGANIVFSIVGCVMATWCGYIIGKNF